MSMYGKPFFSLDCSVGGPSMTKQSFGDEVDINKIVARFEKTGMVEHLNKREPFYGDVTGFKSYHEASNVVIAANEMFMGMTAEIRERFDNDPGVMIDFLADPKNRDEAIKLGMVAAKPEPVVQDVRVVEAPEASDSKKSSKKVKPSGDSE